MSELKRLLDDGATDFERELLRSASTDEPAPGARARTAVAVTVGTATVMAAAGAHAASGASAASAAGAGVVVKSANVGALVVAKWLGLGLLAGAVTTGALIAIPSGSPVQRAPAALAAAPAAPAATRTVTRAMPVATPTAAPTADSILAPSPAATASHAAPATDVSAELALLDKAREAVASGDSKAALDALADHSRRFGTGVLGPEADLLRIEALVGSARNPEAAKAARAFLAAHADSPHAPRVRTLLAKATAGSSQTPGATQGYRAAPATPKSETHSGPSTGSLPSTGGAQPSGAKPSTASFPTQ